jgi:putative SOS response-associated peptidase YedK
MCNRYLRAVALGEVQAGFSDLKIPLVFPEGRPNLGETDICITDIATIVRPSSDDPGAAELVQRRWSWPGPTGKPVFNYRSDGRQFGSGRCLILASGFYEYTAAADPAAKKGAKDRWLFTKADEEWFCIAGLWRKTDKVGEAFTMLTTEPGPDIAPYHNRQVAVLDRGHWRDWLNPEVSSESLIRPLPPGTLQVKRS